MLCPRLLTQPNLGTHVVVAYLEHQKACRFPQDDKIPSRLQLPRSRWTSGYGGPAACSANQNDVSWEGKPNEHFPSSLYPTFELVALALSLTSEERAQGQGHTARRWEGWCLLPPNESLSGLHRTQDGGESCSPSGLGGISGARCG